MANVAIPATVISAVLLFMRMVNEVNAEANDTVLIPAAWLASSRIWGVTVELFVEAT